MGIKGNEVAKLCKQTKVSAMALPRLSCHPIIILLRGLGTLNGKGSVLPTLLKMGKVHIITVDIKNLN